MKLLPIILALVLFAGCARNPDAPTGKPIPALDDARASNASVAARLDTIGEMTTAATGYADATAGYLRDATASLASGAADRVAVATVAIAKADAQVSRLSAILASTGGQVASAKGDTQATTAALAKADDQILAMQVQHAGETKRANAETQAQRARADTAEATIGYRIEAGLKRLLWWFEVVAGTAIGLSILVFVLSRFAGGAVGDLSTWLVTFVGSLLKGGVGAAIGHAKGKAAVAVAGAGL